ncbi:Protein of unknown function [Gryllus bimaculatus]|nr:Protein of unknown function [Gryllus bimaculatus]
MRSYALVALLAALLAGASGITVFKCCDEYEMLSGDGRSCVRTDWTSKAQITSDSFVPGIKVFLPPLNEDWVRSWLPPGLPLHRIESVLAHHFTHYPTFRWVLPVSASCEWNNQTRVGEDVLGPKVIYFDDVSVVRPNPGGGLRTAEYCVDAALPPLGPFAMHVNTRCTENECLRMCCDNGQVAVNKKENWMCEENNQSDWTPLNASSARNLDREYPHFILKYCPRMHLADPQDFSAHLGPHPKRDNFFSFWLTCSAYHRNHSTFQEGLFYCEYPRVARGLYWMLQPLCVVSALLLAVVLLNVACDGSMRQKVHGWCLASHALCLFGFNVGQIVYYVLVRYVDESLSIIGDGCRHFVLAWGLPALLTITCSFLFTPWDIMRGTAEPPWEPSLAEARVCFNEPHDPNDADGRIYNLYSYKYGTAIFFYGPVLSLMFCNVASLSITLRKIKRLRRGNSVLRREGDARQRQAEGNPRCAAIVQSANGGTSGSGNGGSNRREVDAKAIKMYLKMILMTGALEFISEIIIWTTTQMEFKYSLNPDTPDLSFALDDYHLPYRSSGYVTDFLRAVCVAWLAAPEGGYLGPILRRLRGVKK